MTQEEREQLIAHLFATRPAGNIEGEVPEKYKQCELVTDVEEKDIETSAGLTKVWIVNPKSKQGQTAVFVNIHGGGFIAPHLPRDLEFSRRISAELEITVVDISYRTARDAEFPVACFESYDCVKWIYEHAEELNVDRDKIIIAGHSAGANLCVGICLQALEKKEFMPAMQILDYPPLDLVTDPADKRDSDKTLIPPQRARDFNRLYVGSKENASQLLASPYFAEVEQLKGMPDTVLFTAGHDNLRFEGEEFAFKLIQAGTSVYCRRYENSGHGFIIARMDEYDEAIERMEEQIRVVINRNNTFDSVTWQGDRSAE